MVNHSKIPAEHPTTTRPIGHQPSHTRYYAGRVRESLTNRFVKLLCSIFLSILFLAGIIAFIMWLSLRPHRPRFFIRSFSIPGLDQQIGIQNDRISFDITARNSNKHIAIRYGAMDGTVYFRDQSLGQTPLHDPFYQEGKNTTWIHGELSGASLTVDSSRWQAFVAELAKGSVVFRLELYARIRFKILSFREGKSHRMHASCNVAVSTDGQILPTSRDKRCSVYFG